MCCPTCVARGLPNAFLSLSSPRCTLYVLQSGSDYGPYLANEASPLHTTTIVERCTEKLVDDWTRMRANVRLGLSILPVFSFEGDRMPLQHRCQDSQLGRPCSSVPCMHAVSEGLTFSSSQQLCSLYNLSRFFGAMMVYLNAKNLNCVAG